MDIEIIGTESLGVRGLCGMVAISDRKILIDPGLALGYRRGGRLPHPVQVAAGEDTREAIVRHLSTATDVVFSHFHGDHMPLLKANPFQLSETLVEPFLRRPRLWMKNGGDDSARIESRRTRLLEKIGRTAPACDGRVSGPLAFSEAMPHGRKSLGMGSVMMTRLEEGREVFVHASDIQLLDDEPVAKILDWGPTIVLVSGPPIYRDNRRSVAAEARRRVQRIAESVETCVIDHHLLRCRKGVRWLDELRADTGGKVMCAADFMGRSRRFLEADRAELYERFPVPEGWHARYGRGEADTTAFRGRDV